MWIAWLLIRARIPYEIILLVYKVFTSSTPPYLTNVLISKKQMRATRFSLKVNILYMHKTYNNSYTAKAFALAGPRQWTNTLDDKLRGCINVELFKKKN